MKDNHYQQAPNVIRDKRFDTCVKYANYICEFFAEHGIEKWELAGVKARWQEEKPESDNVNPDHYKIGGIETFEVLKAKLTPTELAGLCKGSAIQYITRANHKGKIEDLRKARWYLDALIKEMEKADPNWIPGGVRWQS